MKRCLQQKATDNRNKNRGKQRGLAALCALSLCVALGSFAVLSAPAIAVTEDTAEALGIVQPATPETAAPLTAATVPAESAEPAEPAEAEATPETAALLTGDLSVTLNKVDAATGEETPDATLTLTCTEAAAVPADAVLDVREIEAGSDEYDEYYRQTVQALVESGAAASAQEVHVTHARLFDVNILVNGEKFEPAAPVEVNITYAEAPAAAEDNAERKVVHFAAEDDGTETPEVLDTEVTEAEDGTQTVTYEQTGFSPVVDFGFFVVPRGKGVVNTKASIAAPWPTLPDSTTTFTTSIGVTSANTEGTTTYTKGEYDPETGYFKDKINTKFHIDFSVNKHDFDAESPDSYNYYVAIPEGVDIPADLLNGKVYEDDGHNFDFSFYKGEDGKQYILVKFIPEKIAEIPEADPEMDCYIEFNGEIGSAYLHSKEDEVKVIFGEAELTFKPSELDEDKTETNKYDLKVEKSGSYLVTADEAAKGGYLYYTVEATSYQGTKGDIQLADVLTLTGGASITFGEAAVESVTRTPLTYAGWGGWTKGEPVAVTSGYTFTPSATEGSFDMTLPQLTHGEGGTAPATYTITYKVPITTEIKDSTTTESHITNTNNKITASSETVTDSKDKPVTVEKNRLSKSGTFDKENEEITWLITVNGSGANIAGYTLSDDMLVNAVGDITVTKNGTTEKAVLGTDYTIDSTTGNITFLPMDGTNTNHYYVSYKTQNGGVIGGTQDDYGNTKNDTPPTVTNNATIKKGDDSVTTGATVGVEGGTIRKDYALGSTPNTIDWTGTITVPKGGIAAGTQITDFLASNNWNALISTHYISAAQMAALVENLNTKFPGNYKDLQVCNISKLWSDYNASSAEPVYGFRFTLITAVAQPADDPHQIALNYSSTFDPTDVATSQEYSNRLIVGTVPFTSTYTYYQNVTKYPLVANPTISAASPYFYWAVRVNASTGTAPGGKQYTITDTMPEGVEVEAVYYGVTDGKSGDTVSTTYLAEANNTITFAPDGTGTNQQGTLGKSNDLKIQTSQTPKIVTTTPEGFTYPQQVVTVPIDGSSYRYGYFFVVYKCKLCEALMDSLPGSHTNTVLENKTNTVAVSIGDNASYGSAASSTNISVDTTAKLPHYLDKTRGWNMDGHLLTYTVLINPKAEQLGDGATLTLDDVFTYYTEHKVDYQLVTSSVKLYTPVAKEGETGWQQEGDAKSPYKLKDPVTDGWSFTVSQYDGDPDKADDTDARYKNTKLTVTIPNATAYVLTYQYKVSSTLTDSWPAPKNKVVLSGIENKESEFKDNFQWHDSGVGAGSTTKNHYTITKVEKDNFGKQLGDAVFTLYRYNKDSTAADKWEPVTVGEAPKTYKTDTAEATKGCISILWDEAVFAKNTAYYLVETQAPAGYELPAEGARTKVYFYFSDTDTAAYPTSMPDGFATTTAFSPAPVDLTKTTAASVYIENEKTEVPAYTLPETGGGGTAPYLFGGLALLGAGTLGLTLRKKRERGRPAR